MHDIPMPPAGSAASFEYGTSTSPIGANRVHSDILSPDGGDIIGVQIPEGYTGVPCRPARSDTADARRDVGAAGDFTGINA